MLLTWNSRAADPDLFARVATGRLVLRDWSVPIIDPFAFTLKKDLWIDHEWLSGVIFYLSVNLFGDAGILFLRILMMGLTLWLLSAAMYARARCLPFGVLAAVPLCAYVWTSPLRAQVFTYAALAALGWIMVRVRRTERVPKLYLIAPIFAAWTNLHGGVVAGLGVFLTFCACQIYSKREQRFDWILVGLAALAGAAVSPYGVVRYWGYLLDAVAMERPTIQEWAALDPISGTGIIWLIWVVLLLLGMSAERARLQLSEFAVIAVSVLAGLKANRLTAIAVIIGASYGSVYLAAGCDRILSLTPGLIAPIRRSILLVAIVFMSVSTLSISRQLFSAATYKLTLENYPVLALDWLRSNRRGGKLLNDFNVGSFALWRLYPNFLISLDGRYETVYPDQTVERVSCALTPSCDQWRATISEIAPDFVLIATNELPAWQARSSLRVGYSDSKFTVLEANPALPQTQRAPAQLWQADF